MDDLKSLDEIKKELSNYKTIAPTKIEDKKEDNEMDASNIVDTLHKSAMVGIAKEDEEVKQTILDKAKHSIENELDILDQKEAHRKQQANYDANKEACNNYGIDASVPLWQIRLMKIGSSIWFVIYWIVATFTVCPINVFVKGLKTFIKNSWLVLLVSVLMYLFVVVGVPLIINYLSELESLQNIPQQIQ